MRARFAVEVLEAREVPALTFQFDYSFDTAGFFADPARRAALEQAAADLGSQITTPLAAVNPGGGNTWTVRFLNPATGTATTVANPTVGANALLVYVGGRNLPGSEVGETGAGTFTPSGSAAWQTLLRNRAPTGTSSWGAGVAFDTGTNWFFGTSAAGLARNQTDFYSVAVHELGHVLGIGASSRWSSQIRSGTFVGPSSQAVYGGPVPLGDSGHWRDGITVNGQRVAMDPVITTGTRVPFTALDFAALEDIGWSVNDSVSTTPTQGNPVPWTGTWTSLATVDGVVVLTGARAGTAQTFAQGTDGTLTAIGPSIIPFVGGTGAIRAVAADFNGDGTADLAFGTGVGATGAVRIINGRTGADLVATSTVLDGFRGGVFLAAGDVNGDGRAELAVSADDGGGNRVTIFRVGRTLSVAANFFALDDPTFRGGSRVALADVNNDGAADLIVGAGLGGGPRVAVYDGATLFSSPSRLVPDFFALDPLLRSGVFVTAGDVDGDGFADVLYSTGNTGGPRVRIVGGQTLTANPSANAFALPPLADFFALDANDRSGLRIAARDLDGDGTAEIVAASGAKAAAQVRVLTLADARAGRPQTPISDPFGGLVTLDGIYVG